METWSLQYKEQVAQGGIDVNPAFTDPNVTDAYLVNGRYQPVSHLVL